VHTVTDRAQFIKAQLPDLATLQGALSEGKLHKDIREKSQKILVPYKGYGRRSSDEILREIARERVELCCELITKQNALADMGILRFNTIKKHYNFYVYEVLKGHSTSASLDLWQQGFDVSLMFTLSDSQLKFAKTYSKDDPEKIAHFERMVDTQEKTMMEFKGGVLGEKFVAPDMGDRRTYSQDEKQAIIQSYQIVTLDVAEANLDLCEATLKLVENQARAIYYWRLSLLVLEQSEIGKMFIPHEDLQFESELQQLYLERCQILADRAQSLCELVDRVAEI